MCQDEIFDLRRIVAPVFPVATFFLLTALKKPAIYDNPLSIRGFNQVIGAGYRPRASETGDFDHGAFLCVGLI